MKAAPTAKTAAEKVAERPEKEDYTKSEQARDFAYRFSLTLYELLKHGPIMRDVDNGQYFWVDKRTPEQRKKHFNDIDRVRSDLLFDLRKNFLIPYSEVYGEECAQMQLVVKGLEELGKPINQRAFRDKPPELVTQSNLGRVLVFIGCYNRKSALEDPVAGYQIEVDPIFKLDMATVHLKDISRSYEDHMKEAK